MVLEPLKYTNYILNINPHEFSKKDLSKNVSNKIINANMLGSLMKFKKKIAILLIVSLFVTSSIYLIYETKAAAQDEEDLFLLIERTDEEEEIETRIIFDDFGNFHFFAKVTYENDTFKIIHIVNDETNIVIIDRYPLEFFEVYVVEGGIALIYVYRAFYDITFFRMYTWTPEEGGTDFQIYEYNSRANYPRVRVFQDGSRHFDLFLTFIDNYPPTSENADTEYQHYRVYRDNVTNLWYTDTEVRKVWVAEEEFDYMIDMDYHEGMVYTGYQYIYQGIPDHFYITTTANATTGISNITNIMVINEGGFDPRFFVTQDGVFNLALVRNSILYTLRYGINDTTSFENFTSTSFGIYDYDSFTYQEKSGYTEYIFSSVPYLEYDEFFKGEKLNLLYLLFEITIQGSMNLNSLIFPMYQRIPKYIRLLQWRTYLEIVFMYIQQHFKMKK